MSEWAASLLSRLTGQSRDPPWKMQANPFKPFRAWLRPYWREVSLGLLLLLIGQGIINFLPLVLKQAIDDADPATTSAAGALTWHPQLLQDAESPIAIYAGVLAGLAAIGWLVNFGMRWYFTSLSRYVEADVRSAYVTHLVRLPLRFFHERRVGDLMSRAINDVESIQRFLHHAFRMTLTGILTFFLSLILMCLIDWKLALLSLAPMPVMILATNAVAGRVRNGFRLVQEQFATMSSRIQENLSGMRVVKANALENRQIEGFGKLNDEYVERNRELVVVRSLFFPFAGFLNGVSMIIVLWLGGQRVIEGSLSLGGFVAFNAYLIRMSRPLMMLGRMVDEFQRAIASLARIESVIDHPPEDRGSGSEQSIHGEIELRNVSFAYPGDDTPVLNGVSLLVPAGDTLAIVGRVGSGKSTLARLLPRLLEPTSGEILVDGTPLVEIPLATLRGAIGFVPQDSYLFSETIRENLLIGLDGVSADEAGNNSAGNGFDGRVEWAAEISQLAGDLEDFPAGYETLVGERGVTLSGGQRQRAALARAIIREPRILILDDALASVDTHTEERILEGLKGVMESRTTILIAHRLSSVRHADRIILLDGGVIAESGTHDELVTLGGLYANMQERQSLTQELGEL
jgi:ATP-binding cassette subfamily B multidrug efflux pump